MTSLTFTEHALPYCVFSRGPDSPRVGAGLGGYIVDLHRTFGDQIFAGPSLNAFMSRGPRAWQRTRERLLAAVRGGQISEPVMAGAARDDGPDVGDNVLVHHVVRVVPVHGAGGVPRHQRDGITDLQR